MTPIPAELSTEDRDSRRRHPAGAGAERRRPARRPRGRATAERILDAAEALFAEKGYAGTTLRDVSAVVGIQNPSLYNHFDSKESLYDAVLERGVRPVLEALASAGLEDPPAPRELGERTVALLAQRPDLARLIQHEALSGGQRLTDVLREWMAPAFERGRELLEASSETSRWRDDQRPLLVLALYHVLVGYFATAPLYRELSGEDLLAPEALERQKQFFGDLVEALLGER